MNVKEYIESGILEAYALGALSEQERAQVEADIAMYPELADELTAIEQSLAQLANEHAQKPPAFLQDQIWNAIDGGIDDTSGGTPTRNIPVSPQAPQSAARQVSWVRAAMWAAILVSVATNFILLSQRNETREQFTAKVDSMAIQQQQLTDIVVSVRAERDMIADPATIKVEMGSLKEGKTMSSTIFWNKEKNEAYLALNNMPAAPEGKQYQLWILQDGTPVSMGVIPDEMVVEKGMMKVNASIPNGQAFAISLEQDGGSETPTDVQILGAVSS